MGGHLQAILHLLPKTGRPQGFFNDRIDFVLVAHTMLAQRQLQISLDRQRERIWLLKDQPHLPAELGVVYSVAEDVLWTHQDASRHAAAGNEICQAVETAEKATFATPGRTNDGRHRALRDVDRDGGQRYGLSVAHGQVRDAPEVSGRFAVNRRRRTDASLSARDHAAVATFNPVADFHSFARHST